MRARSLVRLAVPLVVVAAALVHAHVCRAAPPTPTGGGAVDEQAEFEKGRNAYRAHQYEEADAAFLRMLDPRTGTLHDKVLKKQARMYWAATQIALHQDSDASGQFEAILTEDPAYEPDPLAFPTSVVNPFIDARARLHEKLEAAEAERFRLAKEGRARAEAARQHEAERIRTLERLAHEVEITEKHSRWVALLPFGVGQFQNGERRAGWFFLVTESVFVATGLATLPFYYVDLADVHNVYNGDKTAPIAQQYDDRATVVRDVNLIAYGALAATVIAGAIQAEVAYVPDVVKTEPRAIPAITPTAPPAPPSLPSVSFGASPLPGRDARGVRGGSLSVTLLF